MKHLLNFLAALALSVATSAAHASDKATSPSIKLYTLDCGTIEMFDTANFSAEGHFSGPATLAAPCYLIRHPKGDLLWDAGLGDTIADMPGGKRESWGHLTVSRKLTDQLADLGMTAADVDYLALSHWHPDHAGNADLFAGATFLADKAEHAFMFSDSIRAVPGIFGFYDKLETAKTHLFEGRHDVFGDGSVVIHTTPGHTAGHMVLELTLANSGTLLFSGDLYIIEASRALGAIPAINEGKDATKRSIAAFEALAKEKQARVVIQHDMGHFKALPKFPAYLD